MPTERKKPAKDASESGRKSGQQTSANETSKRSSPSRASNRSKTVKQTSRDN